MTDVVVVTGVEAPMGRFVVRAALEAGYEVRGVAWETPRPGDLPDGVAVTQLTDPTTLSSRVLDGASVVVHTAERHDLEADYTDLLEPNVEAVRVLCEACAERDLRLVHISTAAIYDAGRGYLLEDAPLFPHSAYEQSRIDAENEVQSCQGLRWTVLRPGLVYGPFERGFAATLATLAPILTLFLDHIPGIRGGPKTTGVHIEDVARAALHVAFRGECEGRVFNVAHRESLSLGEIVNTLAEAYGLPLGPLMPWPRSALMLGLTMSFLEAPGVLGAVNNLGAQLWKRIVTRYELEPVLVPGLGRGGLPYLRENVELDTDALRSTGFELRHSDALEAYAEVIALYRERRWVPELRASHPNEQAEQRLLAVGFDERWSAEGFELMTRVELPLRAPFDRREGRLDGWLSAPGLADRAELRGTVRFSEGAVRGLARGRAKLNYELGFEGEGGVPMRLEGVRDLNWLGVGRRMRYTIRGSRGECVREGTLNLPLGAWMKALRSARIS